MNKNTFGPDVSGSADGERGVDRVARDVGVNVEGGTLAVVGREDIESVGVRGHLDVLPVAELRILGERVVGSGGDDADVRCVGREMCDAYASGLLFSAVVVARFVRFVVDFVLVRADDTEGTERDGDRFGTDAR